MESVFLRVPRVFLFHFILQILHSITNLPSRVYVFDSTSVVKYSSKEYKRFIADLEIWYVICFYFSLYTGLFISPTGTSELRCATTKTDTAERSISISSESLQVFFVY
jgi:hypothetical protein